MCLVLTKGDLPVTLSRAELDLCLGLEELQVGRRGKGGGVGGRVCAYWACVLGLGPSWT